MFIVSTKRGKGATDVLAPARVAISAMKIFLGRRKLWTCIAEDEPLRSASMDTLTSVGTEASASIPVVADRNAFLKSTDEADIYTFSVKGKALAKLGLLVGRTN